MRVKCHLVAGKLLKVKCRGRSFSQEEALDGLTPVKTSRSLLRRAVGQP